MPRAACQTFTSLGGFVPPEIKVLSLEEAQAKHDQHMARKPYPSAIKAYDAGDANAYALWLQELEGHVMALELAKKYADAIRSKTRRSPNQKHETSAAALEEAEKIAAKMTQELPQREWDRLRGVFYRILERAKQLARAEGIEISMPAMPKRRAAA